MNDTITYSLENLEMTISYSDILYESDRIYAREKIRDCLKVGVFNIEFTKADGSLREMVCTRNSKIIEKYLGSDYSEGNHRKIIEENIIVFDLEVFEWRSFKFEKLSKIELISIVH